MINKLGSISVVHSNHSKNTLDLSLIYWPCHSHKTINKPLISHKRGPKQGREEARKQGSKKEKEEEKVEFSCHRTPLQSSPDFHLAATRRRNSVRLPIDAGLPPGC
ncbi:hypothetical protein M5K25_002613 [Dendrobium thyrsiflorum]|uniref:Uncharacterized protein n=1 Tax=Dendrobium thyrsiflorum TaxID=117978 RepID=A0ABD0VNN8_DENTH